MTPSTPTAQTPRSISNPGEEASQGQLALMDRFKIRGKKGLTRGEAHARIDKWFAAHPEERTAYEAERKERSQDGWKKLVARYVEAAKKKRGTLAATEAQIGGLMRRAFKRPDGDQLKKTILSALNIGTSGAQANVLIRQADGTFQPRQGAQAA
jgi:hypothetical protein